MRPKPVCPKLSSSRLRGFVPDVTNGKGCIASERSAPKRAHNFCAPQLTCGPIRIFALPLKAGLSLRLLGSQRVFAALSYPKFSCRSIRKFTCRKYFCSAIVDHSGIFGIFSILIYNFVLSHAKSVRPCLDLSHHRLSI